MAHDHDHDHSELSEIQLRVRALESVLTEKGYVDPAALDLLIETYEKKVGPRNGARVVARAWADPAYRARLFKEATSAIAELGYAGRQGEHIVALENTPAQHNMVVCTLCSCYPWPVLGLPPVWYKSAPYRSRVVADPRGVLADFGVTLPADTKIRVWDSTAEIRYLVVPMQPSGTLVPMMSPVTGYAITDLPSASALRPSPNILPSAIAVGLKPPAARPFVRRVR